jgi:hypothetical protein
MNLVARQRRPASATTWLTPRSASAAQSLIWKDVALSGNTSHGFAEQIANLEGFLAENWRAGIKTSGNPVYLRPIILTLRREDHTFLLDPILPRPGRVTADYDLVIASQPYRARASLEFKASKVVAPLVQSLRPGGRLVGVHSHGDDPGLEIISLRSLRDHIGRFGRLLMDDGPDDVLRGLWTSPSTAKPLIAGLHFFPFGGLRKTSQWLHDFDSREWSRQVGRTVSTV